MPLVPQVKLTANYHILLWVHHRVTSELRTCQHRSRPRVYAPERKIEEPSTRRDRRYGTNGKREEKKNHAGDEKGQHDEK